MYAMDGRKKWIYTPLVSTFTLFWGLLGYHKKGLTLTLILILRLIDTQPDILPLYVIKTEMTQKQNKFILCCHHYHHIHIHTHTHTHTYAHTHTHTHVCTHTHTHTPFIADTITIGKEGFLRNCYRAPSLFHLGAMEWWQSLLAS